MSKIILFPKIYKLEKCIEKWNQRRPRPTSGAAQDATGMQTISLLFKDAENDFLIVTCS